MRVDQPEFGRLRGEDPIGTTIPEMRQHISDSDTAEFLVRLSDHDDVALQTTCFQNPGKRFEHGGHPGLGVTGPTAQKVLSLDHRIEGIDHHSIHRNRIQMTGDQ